MTWIIKFYTNFCINDNGRRSMGIIIIIIIIIINGCDDDNDDDDE